MTTVSVHELHIHAADLIERVASGERLIVTRDGRPVAELRPIRPTPLTTTELLRRRRGLSHLDPWAWRRDLDAVIDPTV